jgi:hypothetical protein
MRFDAVRSMAVLAFASDEVLKAHNDVHYGGMMPGSGLFEWEKEAVRDHFPPPPARVLVGAAGLGRESFALAEMGYSVTAFEPVDQLVARMRAMLQNTVPPIRVFQGAYQDMPILDRHQRPASHDLRTDPPFDAAVIGWVSLSHILKDTERVETLRRFAEVTHGPILASFFPADSGQPRESGKSLGTWIRRRGHRRRGLSRFVIRGGYCRLLSAEDITRLAKEAGLDVRAIHLRHAFQPHAVFSTV